MSHGQRLFVGGVEPLLAAWDLKVGATRTSSLACRRQGVPDDLGQIHSLSALLRDGAVAARTLEAVADRFPLGDARIQALRMACDWLESAIKVCVWLARSDPQQWYCIGRCEAMQCGSKVR
jgi:hypothetical protein